MFRTRCFLVLAKRKCKATSVVEKGDSILLIKEGFMYKTLLKEKRGFEYWIRDFFSFEKAKEDFDNRVENRRLIETLIK